MSAVASAGGGRPVSLARSVLSHRIKVKMPRIEPRVVLRFENWSATETMAINVSKLEGPTDHSRQVYIPKKLDRVAIYVLSSICATPPNAPTKFSIM